MADEKIITSSVFEQGITEIMQDIANNLYEFEEYTEEAVADLMDLSEEEVAELTRVINDTTVALNKVYSNKKVEDLLSELEVTCNKYADEKIGGLANIHLAYVDSLPSLGEDNTIYILKSTTGGNDTLNLYNNGWLSIGDFAVRLDNYYDKAEVDALLNDKANTNEVVSQNDVVSDMSSVSSSTVLSTAGLEVELNKKVNLDDMTTELDKKVDKDSIATVLDNTATDEQVPSAKAVYESAIQDKNAKTYTDLSQLGLTAPVTVGEIFNALPSNSLLLLKCDDNANGITDVPLSCGILTIDKVNKGRFSIMYKASLGGSVTNNFLYIGTLKGQDGTGLTWQKVCTTTVDDVSNTIVSTNNIVTASNGIIYSVSNGMCSLKFEVTNLSFTTDAFHSWLMVTDDILPISKMGVKFPLVCIPNGKTIVGTVDINDKILKIYGIIPSGTTGIFGSATYPVKE